MLGSDNRERQWRLTTTPVAAIFLLVVNVFGASFHSESKSVYILLLLLLLLFLLVVLGVRVQMQIVHHKCCARVRARTHIYMPSLSVTFVCRWPRKCFLVYFYPQHKAARS